MNRIFAAVLTAAVTVLTASLASATSVVLLDLETHISESHAVVEGVVSSFQASLDPRTGKPVTDVTVDVDELVWGESPGETLVVRQLKGTVGDTTLHFPGAGELRPGARVLLFVMKGEGRWWLTGLAQSIYEIQGTGKAAAAVRQLDELALFERDPVRGVVALDDGKVDRSPVKLAALKARVRAIGKGQ